MNLASRTFNSLAAAALSLIALTAAAESVSPEKAQRAIERPRDKNGAGNARKTLDELARDYGVPGFAIAVIDNFEIAWVKPYGVADVVTGEPVTPETLFQAASISKPVAAMASMKAVQDGLFGLDDDVNTILKSWRVPDNEFTRVRAVTPRMLMSHTSGTDDGFGFPGYDPGVPLPTIVQILNGEPPSNLPPVTWGAAPFTRMKYSGGGVLIQQLALEDAAGKRLAELAHEWLFGPIGMTDSFYVQPLPAELEARAARGHFRDGKAEGVKNHIYPELAAAGLWTTPRDLCKLAIDLQRSLRGDDDHVLSAESAREMVTLVGVGGFAVGFHDIERGGAHYFEHNGINWGFACSLVAARDAGVGMAIMTNKYSATAFMAEIEKRIGIAYGWPGYGESSN